MRPFVISMFVAACGTPNADFELCGDGIDNQGDGLIDCDDPSCAQDPACAFTQLPEEDATGDLDPANGDPALDIIGSGLFETSAGEPWIRVELNAAWPPSSSLFSWFIKLSIDDSEATRISLVTEVHDGTPDTRTEGNLALADTTLVIEPNGVRVLFPAFTAVNYRLETGVLRTEAGLFVQDTAGPFNVTPTPAEFPEAP